MTKTQFLTKKEIALGLTAITLFVGVVRFIEKKIEDAQASALDTSRLELRSIATQSMAEITAAKEQISVERVQRQEDIRGINGKLDTITNMLIRIDRRAR